MASIFTPEEQKIRRRWVLTLMWMIPFDLIVTGLASLDLPNPMEFFLFIALFQLGITGLIYYFTYKRNGHLFLFGTLMSTLTSLPQRFSKNNVFSEISGTAEMVTVIVMLVITLGVWGWWFFISFKLIEIHRSLKPSRRCKKAMVPMQAAQTIEDLDQQLQILKGEFPKYERGIEVAYQEKKNSLIATS